MIFTSNEVTLISARVHIGRALVSSKTRAVHRLGPGAGGRHLGPSFKYFIFSRKSALVGALCR